MKITVIVIIVGQSAVGKTSLFTKIMTNEVNKNNQATMGLETMFKTISDEDEKVIKIQFWDTGNFKKNNDKIGGQERFRAVVRQYYRNIHGIILAYDITRKETFDALEDYWINEIKENAVFDTKGMEPGSNVSLLLVGNKSDLVHNRQVSYENIN